MKIEIKNSYLGENHAHFFKEKGQKVSPTHAKVFISDGEYLFPLEDHLSEEERTKITTVLIDNKTNFEKVSSAVLEKFVDHLKNNYPNLETIQGYNDNSLSELIKLNKLNEELLPSHSKHPLIPNLLQRINTNQSISIGNKIQALEHLNLFLQDASDEQLGQFADKLAQLDQRPHHISDLFKAIASFAVGSTLGLLFVYMSSTMPKGGEKGGIFAMYFAMFSFMGAIGGAYEYGSRYYNNDLEDKYYPDMDKIVEIGNICAKI